MSSKAVLLNKSEMLESITDSVNGCDLNGFLMCWRVLVFLFESVCVDELDR